jgi:hypothetical protein
MYSSFEDKMCALEQVCKSQQTQDFVHLAASKQEDSLPLMPQQQQHDHDPFQYSRQVPRHVLHTYPFLQWVHECHKLFQFPIQLQSNKMPVPLSKHCQECALVDSPEQVPPPLQPIAYYPSCEKPKISLVVVPL